MTNDKPNLTNTAFADMLAEPFAELLKPKKFNFDIAIHHGSDGWGDDVVDGINVEEVEVEKVKAFDVIVDGINLMDPERQRLALTVDELGQLDANDYDYIIQLGVFGKEVYC